MDRKLILEFEIERDREAGTYRCRVPQLKGCISWGNTPDEATKNGVQAAILYLQSLLDHDEALPWDGMRVEHRNTLKKKGA